MQSNAVQQVFNPSMQRALIRIGLALLVVLVVVLTVVFAIRLFKKTGQVQQQPQNDGGGTNPDGTPGSAPGAPLPENIKRLADDLKEASGWIIMCSDLRCDTILAIAELPDTQLRQLAAHYKSMYGQTLKETFDSFYLSGCCFKDAGKVVDAKLKNIQERVKRLNI
ncbi:MAG: hypothetical protein IPM36_18600 [Lewinellaceae bacterium]|nr:hypothetical protein [Lewinellaceae bacterium]